MRTPAAGAVLLALALLATMCAPPGEPGEPPREGGAAHGDAGTPGGTDGTGAGRGTAGPTGLADGSDGAVDDPPEPQVVTVAADRAPPSNDAPVAETVAGMQAFAHALHGEVTGGGNTVFSPLSVALAFGMARAGALGATAEEIDAVLGLPPGVHTALNHLDQALVTGEAPPPRDTGEEDRDPADGPRPPVLAVANGLFAQEGLALEEPFLETLAAEYGAGVHLVDFGDPDLTKEQIDAWVRRHTAERIEELFGQVGSDWLLVLANAVYLRADWETPFVLYPVEDAPFTLASGERVDVATMRLVDTVGHAAGAGWQAVALPYAGSDLAMWVLVPDEGGPDPGDLLAPDVLAELQAGLSERVVDLHLPQWDFEADVDLREALLALGMVTPFGPGADFSAMTPAGVFIGEAVHKATITVDEWGTEAAAVTGIAFPFSGPPEPEVEVRADRPFAFTIVHTPTGAPVFTGTVADPS